MIYDKQKSQIGYYKNTLTQEFDRNRPTVIDISVYKNNMNTHRTQGSSVKDVTTALEKFWIYTQYM